ncbi:MAG: DNA primase [Eubacteriales bacterium]|jgi:DNA primase
MARFPDSFLQELRDRCPVESIVADYVELKRSGANLVGLCPFHREKTPSFNVNPSRQIYKCFGCGEAGSVFNFIMKIENVSFADAVAILAKRAGMELPQGEDADYTRRKNTLLAMNREAARYFHSCLMGPEGEPGRAYFASRQLPLKVIRHWGLGYAPGQWDSLVKHLRSKGFTTADLIDSGLTVTGKNGSLHDRFWGRVMFPIIDVRGNVVAFGGRVLDDSVPKYLNSPETLVFNKSRTLFGLNFAKNEKTDYIILAEGYMDVIALHTAGFRTAVASLGTSLTPDQARTILRYAKEVIISYDSDAAGVKASNRAINILKEAGVAVRVLTIQGGKDPDEFIKTYGAERFARLLKGSDNYIEYRLERLAEQYDLTQIQQKVDFLREATRVLADIDGEVERELYMGKLSQTCEVSLDALRRETSKLLATRKKQVQREVQQQQLEQMVPKVIRQDKDYNSRSFMAEQSLLALLYEYPDLYAQIGQELQESDFLNSLNSRIYRAFRERLETGQEVDLAVLSQEFTAEESGYLASLVARETHYDDRLQAARDLIEVLQNERGKMLALGSGEEDLSGMQAWYEQMKQKKKNGS